jgi:hypothetical protein
MRVRARPGPWLWEAIGFWFVLAALATTGGIIRERWLVGRVSELHAHQIGTLVVTAAFLVAIARFVRRTQPSVTQAQSMGCGWLLGAIGFEFGFGHYADGLSWARLLADYQLWNGRLLLLVWLTVALGPLAFTKYGQRQNKKTLSAASRTAPAAPQSPQPCRRPADRSGRSCH